jgi:hypothetical protein
MTGSVASMSVLDDEQIENLMMETGTYVSFLAKHAEAGPSPSTQTLPSKLSYLQDYVKFNAQWVDEYNKSSLNQKQTDNASQAVKLSPEKPGVASKPPEESCNPAIQDSCCTSSQNGK